MITQSVLQNIINRFVSITSFAETRYNQHGAGGNTHSRNSKDYRQSSGAGGHSNHVAAGSLPSTGLRNVAEQNNNHSQHHPQQQQHTVVAVESNNNNGTKTMGTGGGGGGGGPRSARPHQLKDYVTTPHQQSSHHHQQQQQQQQGGHPRSPK
ncbi:AGAP006460-PA-like protein [Anopheles sinensis]|uniref:AGAP006460-PA-like protein n=1 Tax=Anopheles sinensis TaxID=74873 RepID=A0A084VAY4_ANOSI|nr:AGAP006460-PA-like protein [Anopheles sinensis]